MNKYWKMQQGEKPATADIYLYGDIEGDTKNWWTGEILPSPTSANTFKNELEALGKLEEVNIYINSFGGYCSEGHAIANIIRRCKAKTVAHIDAYAASVASIIACACDEVRMPRNTVMMIHNAWVPYASGNAAQLRKLADDLDTENAAFKTVYLEKSNGKITPKKLDELLDNETYLTAEECFNYGFCDVIEDFSAEMKDPDEAQVKAAERNRVDLNKVCAMIRGETGKTPVQTVLEPTEPEPQTVPEPTKSESQANEPEPVGNGGKVNTNKLDAEPAPSFIMSILRKRKEDNND